MDNVFFLLQRVLKNELGRVVAGKSKLSQIITAGATILPVVLAVCLNSCTKSCSWLMRFWRVSAIHCRRTSDGSAVQRPVGLQVPVCRHARPAALERTGSWCVSLFASDQPRSRARRARRATTLTGPPCLSFCEEMFDSLLWPVPGEREERFIRRQTSAKLGRQTPRFEYLFFAFRLRNADDEPTLRQMCSVFVNAMYRPGDSRDRRLRLERTGCKTFTRQMASGGDDPRLQVIGCAWPRFALG